ncbi:MAG: hypothetical protein HOE19_04620 [Candidatus Komeilibacteria bacterium]|jgi:hypothetical protein|nr:hypothetical protein [Candidatus Komeilibacteria bacterium]MBT4447955.1 hypothetical protein [Candidatus Komeilibacteria bacterium]
MFKKVNNWHLSILIIIVSVLSVSLVQKYVMAAWQEPSSVPGSVANRNLVLNPMQAELSMGNYNIVGTNITIATTTNALSISNNANLCLTGDCRSAWPAESTQVWSTNALGIHYVSSTNPRVGIGTAIPDELLHIDGGNLLVSNGNINMADDVSIKGMYGKSYTSILFLDSDKSVLNLVGNDINFKDLSGNDLVYIDDIGAIANLGIGTNSPNKSLHIKTPSKINAEINIESGANTHWGMYQHEGSADLRFWHNDDNVVFDSAGYVGIGTTTPSNQLHVESDDQTAIYGKAETAGKYGVYGEHSAVGGSGVYGLGYVGVTAAADSASGIGILASQGVGDYAGYFTGDVEVASGDLKVSAGGVSVIGGGVAVKNGDLSVFNGYIKFPEVTSNPPDSSCNSADDVGKAVFNSTTGALVICNYEESTPIPWREYHYEIAIP